MFYTNLQIIIRLTPDMSAQWFIYGFVINSIFAFVCIRNIMHEKKLNSFCQSEIFLFEMSRLPWITAFSECKKCQIAIFCRLVISGLKA